MDTVSFSEEEMDSAVNQGQKQNKEIESSDQALKSTFGTVTDESGGDIAQEWNQYTQELNKTLQAHYDAFEENDATLKASRGYMTDAKETVKGQISSR